MPSMMLDLHSLCIQQLQLVLKRHNEDLTLNRAQPTFQGSTVLDAALSIYRALTLFNRDGSVLALASGVLPPKQLYPSRGLSRKLALPLAQEFVLRDMQPEYEELSVPRDCNGVPTCAGGLTETAPGGGRGSRLAELEHLLRMIDVNNDLLTCLEPMRASKPETLNMDMDKWEALDEDVKTYSFKEVEASGWGGADFVSKIRYR